MDTSVKLINLTEHYDDLLKIWQQCFPEDENFAVNFLQNAAPYSECIAAFEEDKPVSMAFFLQAVLHIDGSAWKARYVYGVATLPAYRGKGYAGKVLQAAAHILSADLLYLYPATPSLRSYYAKRGYRDFFFKDTIKVAAELPAKFLSVKEIQPFCAADYAVLRQRFLCSHAAAYAVFPVALLQTLLQHFSVITFDGGAALLLESEQAVFLPEILCDTETLDKLLCTVSARYPSKSVIATVPGSAQPSGMLLPLSPDAVRQFKKMQKQPFFGTMFDI